MKRALLLAALLAWTPAWAATQPAPTVVAVQPLGDVDESLLAEIREGIAKTYRAEVVVLDERELPAAAYYRPRDRYRADTILDVLGREAQGAYTKVVGVTERDISATRGEVYDWGVFGLGEVGGTPCVVSSYRLRRGVSRERLVERIVRAVNHELGHTFGLDHCPAAGCLMADAAGTSGTIDGARVELCAACRERLAAVVRPPEPKTVVEAARPARAGTANR